LFLAGLLLAPIHIAQAEEEPIPANAKEIEVHKDFTLTFKQVDLMTAKDPVAHIAGITDQFLNGETILGEAILNSPVPRARIDAMREAKQPMAFQCESAGVYEIEGARLVSGRGCEIVPVP